MFGNSAWHVLHTYIGCLHDRWESGDIKARLLSFELSWGAGGHNELTFSFPSGLRRLWFSNSRIVRLMSFLSCFLGNFLCELSENLITLWKHNVYIFQGVGVTSYSHWNSGRRQRMFPTLLQSQSLLHAVISNLVIKIFKLPRYRRLNPKIVY